MIEKVPIELVELIKQKPVVAYLMLKITTKYLLLSMEEKKAVEDEDVDLCVWNFINKYEAGDEEIAYKPEELN